MRRIGIGLLVMAKSAPFQPPTAFQGIQTGAKGAAMTLGVLLRQRAMA
jgi:hypothetical protein